MDAKTGFAERNFILQQGFGDPAQETCGLQFAALQFQPRIVGTWALLATFFQSPVLFLVLSAVLWWGALLPQWNLFELIYNSIWGGRPGALRLPPPPAPRRFAQGMAGTFALAIGLFLLLQWRAAAYVLEVILLLAVAALIFGKFCLGSFVFHLLRGRAAFARETLPWRRME